MPTTIFYLHGFNSGPASIKAQQLGRGIAALDPRSRPAYFVPQLHHRPAVAMREMMAWIDTANSHAGNKGLAFVGSSLGGFYATFLAEHYGAKAVLINPAIRPAESLASYLGPQRNTVSGETYELRREHFAELEAFNVVRVTEPQRYLLLVQSNDSSSTGAKRWPSTEVRGSRCKAEAITRFSISRRKSRRSCVFPGSPTRDADAPGAYTRAMVKPTLADKLVVAISSRALFDLTDSHRVYTEAGVDAYHRYQIEHEEEILAPGPAFVLVKKLLRLNRPEKQYVEVILLSRNSADTGLRVFNAIKHYGLDISRAAFTKGEPTSRYVPAFGAHLFLSADTEDVKRVLDDGYAAATIVPSTVGKNETDDLRIAFDGDAVLFSDEAERVYQKSGLAAFSQSETDAALRPLSGGPFKEFLAGLHRIQSDFAADQSPIRTALVTARSAPAHERVIRTLRAWNIRIDEALFLGGLDKGEFLRAFGADIFFDDQHTHIESAAKHVASGHVPHGILNER